MPRRYLGGTKDIASHMKKRQNTSEQKALAIPDRIIEKFLDHLRLLPNVEMAASLSGLKNARFLYLRKELDRKFSERWDNCLSVAVGRWERAAAKRAFEGVDEPVFQLGKRVGTVKKYSDLLAIRILEAHHPLYRKKVELSGPDGKPLAISFADLARRAAHSASPSFEEDD